MITVNVYSAGEPKGTMEVSHIDGNTTMERFEAEWNGCVDGVKELFPDSWSVCDVEDAMTQADWQMKDIKILDVEY